MIESLDEYILERMAEDENYDPSNAFDDYYADELDAINEYQEAEFEEYLSSHHDDEY